MENFLSVAVVVVVVVVVIIIIIVFVHKYLLYNSQGPKSNRELCLDAAVSTDDDDDDKYGYVGLSSNSSIIDNFNAGTNIIKYL